MAEPILIAATTAHLLRHEDHFKNFQISSGAFCSFVLIKLLVFATTWKIYTISPSSSDYNTFNKALQISFTQLSILIILPKRRKQKAP